MIATLSSSVDSPSQMPDIRTSIRVNSSRWSVLIRVSEARFSGLFWWCEVEWWLPDWTSGYERPDFSFEKMNDATRVVSVWNASVRMSSIRLTWSENVDGMPRPSGM